MEQGVWSAVDEYVGGLLAPHDPALEAALKASDAAGLPAIQVSVPQGKLLELLARALGAKAILEFGTLGGYSTIWLGRALVDGDRLITLEADPGYAEVARANIAQAGLEDLVDLRVGAALDVLPELETEDAGPFDLTFIDADKVHTPDYFAWALEHSHRGSLILADNVVRDGTLADADSDDPKDSGHSVACTRCSPPSPESTRRRFRPSAARATTGSPSPWLPASPDEPSHSHRVLFRPAR